MVDGLRFKYTVAHDTSSTRRKEHDLIVHIELENVSEKPLSHIQLYSPIRTVINNENTLLLFSPADNHTINPVSIRVSSRGILCDIFERIVTLQPGDSVRGSYCVTVHDDQLSSAPVIGVRHHDFSAPVKVSCPDTKSTSHYSRTRGGGTLVALAAIVATIIWKTLRR